MAMASREMDVESNGDKSKIVRVDQKEKYMKCITHLNHAWKRDKPEGLNCYRICYYGQTCEEPKIPLCRQHF